MKRYIKSPVKSAEGSRKRPKATRTSSEFYSMFRVSSKIVDNETIEVSVYNPMSKYSMTEEMSINDDPDELAEYFISDNELGISKNPENYGNLANILESLWY